MCAQTTTLRAPAASLEVLDQLLERLRHVAVAQVPRRDPAAEHRAVVLLGVHDQPRVLLGVEVLVLGDAAVAARVLAGARCSSMSWLDHLVFARLAEVEASGVAVRLRVLAEVLEARVALARPTRRIRVDLLEIRDDRLHRGVQAVEVEAVEADLGALGGRASLCARSQPTKSSTSVLRHIHFGKRRKSGQRLVGARVVAATAHVAVDAIRVRPVGLDRDGGEALLADQPLGDLGALAIELVRAVRRFAEQDEARADRALESSSRS